MASHPGLHMLSLPRADLHFIDFASYQPNLKSQHLIHSLLMPLIALFHRPFLLLTWHIFLSNPHIRMCYLRTKRCET